MNVISYTDNYYLDSAIRHLFSSAPASSLEKNVYIELASTLLDFIVVFNDKKPAESLIQLLTYPSFKSGGTLLVITNIVPAKVITRFIPAECRLIVQSAKSPLSEWFTALKFSADAKESNATLIDIHKPLLTYTEKKLLSSFNGSKTQNDFSKSYGIKAKTASSHKRSIMRKLGVQDTPQLLGYVNAHCFVTMLSHL